VPGVYDRDFDKRVVTAREAGVNVAVAGSGDELETLA
jgi:hypothetical protein